MPTVLDIPALRSFTAIADCGGFHRAAESLRLAQPTVSQHVRRLENALGRPLVERRGRGTGFTPDGEILLAEARVILQAHDNALERLGSARRDLPTIGVGSTEHAADRLLPRINQALGAAFSDCQVTFRIDRGSRLADALGQRTLDVALLIGAARGPKSHYVGDLPLAWYAAPGWEPPPDAHPLPLVVIDDPCTIRRQALRTLAEAGRRVTIVGQAGHLAGVLHAVRAGVGVALIADVGRPPEGLERRDDLPPAPPEPLHIGARAGATDRLVATVVDTVRAVLA
ncbi:putative LysR family transcriptional regulator [Actinacidiphila reveromycinica]|uniref:Putative LysR family transcriptional regulator n=1 Tax=Actinacidiphila reveromycinica TaxID=659352 RepID=A0A7U3VLF0_9ACTN|nr:LysR family transcriptional regulator [Streptomyces sp. SN-593]BBA95479.1 putative LysR family transcriptional regulator [Streptomyces sp. SN-593]